MVNPETPSKTSTRHQTKKTGSWRLWLNEIGISGALWLYRICDLDKLGLGQKPLAYDVDEEEI